jgi:hypothetical protein
MTEKTPVTISLAFALEMSWASATASMSSEVFNGLSLDVDFHESEAGREGRGVATLAL